MPESNDMSSQKTNSNVLICDDDEILLSFYKRVIKNAGYDVLTAGNGDEAIEILNEMPVALAISPGERTEKGDTLGGWGDEATTPAPP